MRNIDSHFAFVVFRLPIPAQVVSVQPSLNFAFRLLHQHAHWQAVNKKARPARLYIFGNMIGFLKRPAVIE
jgi:hypothetical protein